MKIELIENNSLNTYNIKFDEEKIEPIKKEILNYSKEYLQNVDLYFSHDFNFVGDMETFLTVMGTDYDEFLGCDGLKNYRFAKLRNYPILYNVLFGKYVKYNSNIYKTMLLYLTNQSGLMNDCKGDLGRRNISIIDDNVNVPLKGKIKVEMSYDRNISLDKKVTFIEKILDCMEFTLETSESLKDINKQIEFVSNIKLDNLKAKTDFIKLINERIEKAKDTASYYSEINIFINKYKSKKNISKQKRKKGKKF